MKKKFTVAFIVSLGLLKILGIVLDREANIVAKQLYEFDDDGIIKGLGPVAISKKAKKAVVLIPGLLESTEIFQGLANILSSKLDRDIFIPLWPHMGRNLDSKNQFSNDDNLPFLRDYLDDLAKKYETVHLLAHSYGGAAVVTLHRQNLLAPNLRYLFYAPALHVRLNNPFIKGQFYAYLLWRDYCPYDSLGCIHPGFGSGDEGARDYLLHQKSPPYTLLAPVLEVFELDSEENRNYYAHFADPHHVIMAEDDNRMFFEKHEKSCRANANCKLVSFPSGKHIVHLGNRRDEFANILVEIIEDKKTSTKSI